MSKRTYKATIVLDARDSEGGSDELISRITDLIQESEGEVQKVENLGNLEFSRPANRDFSTGAYMRFDFESEPDVPARLQEKLQLEKRVDRAIVEKA